MDEQLKARLIGAAILVAIAVLLIPELLSGRKAEAPETVADGQGRGTRTYTIDLGSTLPAPGSGDARPAAPAPALPTAELRAQASRAPAQAAAGTPVAESSPPPSAPQPAKQEPEPAEATRVAPPATDRGVSPPASPTPKPAAPVAKGGWSVQVGAFGSAATANKLVADLRSAGYRAYLSPISKSGKTLHRVRVGPEAARPDADKLAARLRGRNLPATVVAND
jgi:DedD protein